MQLLSSGTSSPPPPVTILPDQNLFQHPLAVMPRHSLPRLIFQSITWANQRFWASSVELAPFFQDPSHKLPQIQKVLILPFSVCAHKFLRLVFAYGHCEKGNSCTYWKTVVISHPVSSPSILKPIVAYLTAHTKTFSNFYIITGTQLPKYRRKLFPQIYHPTRFSDTLVSYRVTKRLLDTTALERAS